MTKGTPIHNRTYNRIMNMQNVKLEQIQEMSHDDFAIDRVIILLKKKYDTANNEHQIQRITNIINAIKELLLTD